MSQAITAPLGFAHSTGAQAVAVEELGFTDQTSREKHGRNRRFRRLLSGFPTRAFRTRLAADAPSRSASRPEPVFRSADPHPTSAAARTAVPPAAGMEARAAGLLGRGHPARPRGRPRTTAPAHALPAALRRPSRRPPHRSLVGADGETSGRAGRTPPIGSAAPPARPG